MQTQWTVQEMRDAGIDLPIGTLVNGVMVQSPAQILIDFDTATADIKYPEKKPCFLCGNLTTGSIGAAGMYWASLCQPCKNKEDGAAMQNLVRANEVYKSALERMFS